MDYPTTGRRRQRSGGVSVAQLVERSHPVDESSAVTLTATLEPVDHPTRHNGPSITTIPAADAPPAEEALEGSERGTSTLARVCRTASLTIGVLAVAAAVTTAATIDKHQQKQQAAPPSYEITGVQALRPDAVAAHLGEQRTGSDAGRSSDVSPLPSPSDGQADDVLPRGMPRAGQVRPEASTTPGQTTSADANVNKDESPAGVVRHFYQVLAKAPGQAAGLLAPTLIGTNTQAFVRSWRQMRALRVEQLADHPDGTVTAVVRMLEPDGSWLRVRQLITTTDGDLPMIGTVRLVSAQRG